jgi:glucose/arabinose dehydrogenase/cytochrome c551/c552
MKIRTSNIILVTSLILIQFFFSCNKPNKVSNADEQHLDKVTLLQGQVLEPMEMAILPNLDVLIVERKGNFVLYDHQKQTISNAGEISVYYKDTLSKKYGNQKEDGLLGIAIDPDFLENGYIYAYYSPVNVSICRLSRFTFTNGKVLMNTEKIILEVKTDRNAANHMAGSLTFGNDRMLYLSIGDNTIPFNQHDSKFVTMGYAPLDNRKGFERYDSRRSSANTADLRGKILRIIINEDGTYSIPKGNLFPVGTDSTRPEIYVMGNRNPFRISVDKKTNYLYWGEVGPDASIDSFGARGPRGYDELNQARAAGNFGWPFFIGNNLAYQQFDFESGLSGVKFDSIKPINDSKNNTGIQQLPPAKPSLIWYPYSISTKFPSLGSGSRNAMAGPVFNADVYPQKTRLPDYLDGKLFFYDWIRDWVNVVTLNKNGDFIKMDPFMPSTKWNGIIDMEIGPDGKLYVLEYGKGWFTDNPDAGLSRIDFYKDDFPLKGNLVLEKGKTSIPLHVKASTILNLPSKNKLIYKWHFGDKIIVSNEPKAEYDFNAIGKYEIYLEIQDNLGKYTKTKSETVIVGNTIPEIKIEIAENQKVFKIGEPIAYKIIINDKEDKANIDTSNIFIAVEYVKTVDKTSKAYEHLNDNPTQGKILMQDYDCKSCHKTDELSIGPSFSTVAAKYDTDVHTIQYLINKIIRGGGGVWGENVMPAHPNLQPKEAQKLVNWILSLKNTNKQSLPLSGKLIAQFKDAKSGEFMKISASYTDKGFKGLPPQTGNSIIYLTNYNTTFFSKLSRNVLKYFKK